MTFPAIPRFTGSNLGDWAWRATSVINNTLNGKTNNTGTLTLDANQDSTDIALPRGRLGNDSVILFMPTTSNAAQELASGNMYVSNRDVGNDTFTIAHRNNAQTDRSFYYVLVG